MSGQVFPQTDPQAFQFADADIVDIRRYCGYPFYGAGVAGFQSWRYFTEYGLEEFRIRNYTATEAAVVLAKLATLRQLEAAVIAVSGNLDTAQAAVWTHNPDEFRDQVQLYTERRMDFCATLGVPPGPGLKPQGSIRWIV